MIQTKEATVQRYPAYKDSGVEWLGEIPEHWEVKKLKHLGSIFPGLSGKKGDDFSKEYKKEFKPFIPFTNICNNLKIDNNQYQFVHVGEFEKQNRVQKNDILFLMSSETLEDIGKCSLYDGENEEVYLNSFCKGFRFNSNRVSTYFINYLLQGEIYRKYFSTVGRGFTRINLKQEYINDLNAILPPLPEQTAIAYFLDTKTTKIDTAIAQKEKMIALLKERKQIVIQNAVTGKWTMTDGVWGPTPKEKMKDSGVEWIGEVPEGWEVKKVKHLVSYFKGFAFKSIDFQESSGIPIVKASNIKQLRITNVKSFISENNQKQEFNNFRLKEGDIIISTVGSKPEIKDSAVGQLAYVSKRYENAYLNQNTICFRTNNLVLKEFMKFVLISFYMRCNFDKISLWIANQAYLEIDTIRSQIITIPNTAEQKIIIRFIQKESTKIDKAISLQQTQIEKLKEYKSTLIDSAVTGKIKVN